jgi:hypothetical protein
MKKWILGTLVAISAPALAGDFRLEAHLASKHFVNAPGTLREYNEKHVGGFGIEYVINEKYHFTAGGYPNSINEQSYYAGFGKLLKAASTDYFWKRYELGVELGVANGYKDFVSEDGRHWEKPNDYSLMGGPYIRLGDVHALKIRYAVSVATAGYQYAF